ncbi:MAG: hypothetical protein IJW03_03070 [Clostridia bacterium]|nr:hypothetical protein [Clostridia bacterium]
MVKTRKILTVVTSIIMIICTLFVTMVPASAATRSKGTATQTIIVKTKANWLIPGSESITLKQERGVCKSTNIFTGKVKESKFYGVWDIEIEATDGSHTEEKTLKGSSLKINLKPNKTYKITVTWDTSANNYRVWGKGSIYKYPTWMVSKTYKVSSCR